MGDSRHERATTGRGSRIFRTAAVLVAVAMSGFCVRCGGPYQDLTVYGEEAYPGAEKVRAEAYLFDCKVLRAGKRTSLRLEVFQTDSVLGLGGRAYLGKGALKGRLTADSLMMYFPSRKQYVDESLHDVIAAGTCPLTLGDLDILQFFHHLPDSLDPGRQVRVVSNHENGKRPGFLIFVEGCPWRIELTYDLQPTGWRIRKFHFTDGEGLTLRANRREYKASANVKASKFYVSVPPQAVRVSP